MLASSKLGKSADQNANELTTDSVNIFKAWVSPNRAKRLVYGDSQKEKESKGELAAISTRDRRMPSRIRWTFGHCRAGWRRMTSRSLETYVEEWLLDVARICRRARSISGVERPSRAFTVPFNRFLLDPR
jgi:hypothetical protein